MPTARHLKVALSANTDKFRKGMKQAQSRLQKFAAGVKGMASRMAKFGAVLGGVAAAGLLVWIKRTASAIDATAKLSDRIGIATEDLQGLRHAAQLTGSDSGTLDKSLQFLAKALGEAQTGIGEAKQALESMGFSFRDFIGLSPYEQVQKLADAFGELDSQEAKAYAATKLFGRSGMSLVNLLDQGSAGIRTMREEAVKLGIAYGRGAGSSVEKMNDALTRVKQALQGVVNTLTIALAGPVAKAAKAFTDWATSGDGLSVRLLRMFERVAVGFQRFVNSVSNNITKLRLITGAVTGNYGSGQFVSGDAGVAGIRGFFRGLHPTAGGLSAKQRQAMLHLSRGNLLGAIGMAGMPTTTSAQHGLVGGARGSVGYGPNDPWKFGRPDLGSFGADIKAGIAQYRRDSAVAAKLDQSAYYANRISGDVAGAFADGVRRGLREGFSTDVLRDMLVGFQEAVTGAIIDAIADAFIRKPLADIIYNIGSSLATSAATSGGGP